MRTNSATVTRKNRPGLLLLLALLFATGIVVLLYRLVIPTPPPAAVDVPEAGNKALTGRVALIIIDGLRYDIGVDSEQMPYMARRMRETGGTEIWANQVTMTSSAITTYATGQRGDLDQVVNNETATPTPYNHLFENLRNAGLTTAAVGDNGWFNTYPNAWDFEHRDPRGVAIDVDYNDRKPT
ncbi:MAG TPA: hypothetical protein EYN66_13920 [Myxococcales bacterium]|nr:hypothetical protein [Myxococcales bacterium]